MGRPDQGDKKGMLTALATAARIRAVDLRPWIEANFHAYRYNHASTAYVAIQKAFANQVAYKELDDIQKTRGRVTHRDPNAPQAKRFSYGIPADPPHRHVRTAFRTVTQDPKVEKEEKVERKSPPIRFSDAYVEGCRDQCHANQKYEIDLKTVGDMLQELLDLRRETGKSVRIKAEMPSQKGTIGALSFD